MGLLKKETFRRNHFFVMKGGQITLTVVWKILAIIGLVIAAGIIFYLGKTESNYLAKFYDCLRFGGCWK